MITERRRPGAPLGNQNRLIHGDRSKQSVEQRRRSVATVKTLGWAAHASGLVEGRCRFRHVGPDQIELLPDELVSALAAHYPIGAVMIRLGAPARSQPR